MPRGSKPTASSVAILARSVETLRALGGYLEGCGLQTAPLRRLDEIGAWRAQPAAMICFPDEFLDEDFNGSMRSLRQAQPKLLLVMVTRDAASIADAVAPLRGSLVPIVMPRPSFGWAIVDVLREHGRACIR
jgi:hypothetical protein